MTEEEFYFCNFITNSLRENPDWLPTALHGIFQGTTEAYIELKDKYNDLDAAFLASMILLKKERISKENIKHFNDVILQKIKNTKNRSALEDELIKQLATKPESLDEHK